ncbi:hypothetical protein [Ferruginibacter sp.]|nr:hypothetical protein [Ferruginibacter sp.]
MDNSLTILASQYYKEVKKRIFIKADKNLKNSEYSNIRRNALQNDIDFFESKRVFTKLPEDRIPENEVSKEFIVDDITQFEDENILTRYILKNVTNWLKSTKVISSITKNKSIFSWDKAIILTIKFRNTSIVIIECRFPFADKRKQLITESLTKITREILTNVPQKKSSIKVSIDSNVINIPWDDIEFLDRKLIIKNNKELNSIECMESSKELQELKKILFKKSNLGLKINIAKKPYIIINLEILNNIIKFLKIQYKFTNNFLSVPEFKELLNQTKQIQKACCDFLF